MTQRMDLPAAKRQKKDGDMEPDKFNPAPSKVVHIRALTETAVESDITTALQYFGSIKNVLVFPNRKQALVEYEDLESASQCVEYGKTHQIYINGEAAHVNYSTSEKINKQGGDSGKENKVLLFTIINPQYPITTETMYTICSQCGTVYRIVIFRKNGVQAMVEFDSLDSAKRAKMQLNGCDIYSGCCTLKIEYARPESLNVERNDNDTYDFTRPELGPYQQSNTSGYGRTTLLGTPQNGGYSGGQGGSSGGGGGGGGGGMPNMPPPNMNPAAAAAAAMAAATNTTINTAPGLPPISERAAIERFIQSYNPALSNFIPQESTVLMIYGLNPERMNCDTVFNLICLYGNVAKVKWLKSKEGTCMVQVTDHMAGERIMANLNNATFFNSRMQISLSKQKALNDVYQPYALPDGSVSFKDFSSSRNNRYSTPEQAAKNRVLAPSEVLHYWNVPPGVKEDELLGVMHNLGCATPKRIKIFPAKEEQRSSSGLIEYYTVSDAIEAVCIANHGDVPVSGGKYPFIMKLSFSNQNQLGTPTINPVGPQIPNAME